MLLDCVVLLRQPMVLDAPLMVLRQLFAGCTLHYYIVWLVIQEPGILGWMRWSFGCSVVDKNTKLLGTSRKETNRSRLFYNDNSPSGLAFRFIGESICSGKCASRSDIKTIDGSRRTTLIVALRQLFIGRTLHYYISVHLVHLVIQVWPFQSSCYKDRQDSKTP